MCIQTLTDKMVSVTINLTPEEIQERFGDSLDEEISGYLHDVLTQLIISFVGIEPVKSSGF